VMKNPITSELERERERERKQEDQRKLMFRLAE
jgi:hypothetical protein